MPKTKKPDLLAAAKAVLGNYKLGVGHFEIPDFSTMDDLAAAVAAASKTTAKRAQEGAPRREANKQDV